MKIAFTRLPQAWQRRNRREQWIVCCAALALALMLADTLIWNPWRQQVKSLVARTARAEQELRQSAAVPAGATAPNDAAALKHLQDLRQRLADAEQHNLMARQQVVAPAQMAARLRAITETRGAVTVVALRSLPVTPVGIAGPLPLYRHSFELLVEGSYADIARYVESLEQTAGGLRWNAVELDASRHPVISARLEVFTLSEQASWIQL